MKVKKFGFSAKAVLLITALLLAADIVLGVFLIYRARSSIRSVINERMLGVATTAAAMLDGDELAALTESDDGGEKQQAIIEQLGVFDKYLNFKYIYIVRARGDGKFVFIVDADPEKPADFGKVVVDSPALEKAGSGTAAVDDIAVDDEWGKYYTAFCPVFAKDGSIGGIVGVDFDASWYEDQIAVITVAILISGIFALLVGSGAVLLITGKLRQRFRKLNEDTASISADVASLIEDIRAERGYELIDPEMKLLAGVEEELPPCDTDEEGIEKLSHDVKRIKVNLKHYINFIHSKAYTDVMTGIGNRSAYFNYIRDIDEEIKNTDLRFSVAVFDINGLKTANDDYGHDIGDAIIGAAADCIKKSFGENVVFRIGGDEFVAVLKDTPKEAVEETFKKLDSEIVLANEKLSQQTAMTLSLSKGAAEFIPGEDNTYKQVFKRADVDMYFNKNDYYQKYGYRR
ncbi:MAG: diguanylate cyclase [Clostridia bacterium]|nr:diguanylate cyclase [Clostridia bacterium]